MSMSMSPTEHTSKTPRTTTGIFALLGALLRVKGTGASKITQGTGVSSPTPLLATLATIAAALLASAGLTAILPASAQAYATLEAPPTFSSAPGLPDGRVYEQVSPTNKNGNEAGATTQAEPTAAVQHYGYAAPDGNSVLFEGTGPMGESSSVDNFEFVAHHTAGGWSTRALEPALHRNGKSIEELFAQDLYVDPSLDLSHAMVETHYGTLASSLPNEECGFKMYLTGPDPFVAATWLERPEISDPVENCEGTQYAGAPVGGTPDFSTVYFTYPGTLLPEDSSRAVHATGKAWGFYEDKEGSLREAGVLPNETLDAFGAVPAASGHDRVLAGNEVSENGKRAFFVSPDPGSCKPAGQNECATDPPELYVRENGEKTVLVSQSQLSGEGGAPAPSGPLRMPNPPDGSYIFASPDGSQAFFQSDDQLTSDAPENTSPKTYDFDVNTGTLTYLPGVVGEIVASDTEGTSFAFVRPEAGPAPAELDLWSGPEAGHVTPVAQLPGPLSSGSGEEGAQPTYVPEARMSTDGSVLVFETEARIAGFNNGGTTTDARGDVEPGSVQVYRYDVPADTLGCVSCAPAGVTPRGPASISSLQPYETYEFNGFNPHGVVDSRGISADGDRVFFDSPDPLVPQDTNTNSPAVPCETGGLCPQGRDVYEWENGVVYLISGGKSSRNSLLLDNSENGDDVFFATTEGLVPGDTDGGYDVYDARVPRETQTPAAVPCEGSVCQGPPNVPSPLTPPASATFSGLGNPAPEPAPAAATTKTVTKKAAKCKKGYVKNKKGKCVKKKTKAKKASTDRRVK
jgi:hypothetical protein